MNKARGLLDFDGKALRFLKLMGWGYLLCANNAAEETHTASEVYQGRLWTSFHSPTFYNDRRVRDITKLENGELRVTVEIGESARRSEFVLAPETKLTCFVPTQPVYNVVHNTQIKA